MDGGGGGGRRSGADSWRERGECGNFAKMRLLIHRWQKPTFRKTRNLIQTRIRKTIDICRKIENFATTSGWRERENRVSKWVIVANFVAKCHLAPSLDGTFFHEILSQFVVLPCVKCYQLCLKV